MLSKLRVGWPYDENIKDQTQAQKEAQDPIQGIGEPMIRARAKKIQEALQHIVAKELLLSKDTQFQLG